MNKKEVEKYLSDPNVRIGIEIEFIIPKFERDYEKVVAAVYNYNDMVWDYDLYCEKLADWYESEGTPPKVPKWAKKMGYKDGEDIPDPEEFMSNSLHTYFRSLVKYFRPDKLPFRYKVYTDYFYHNKEVWCLKPDSTIGAAGIEISSPIMSLPQFLDVCPKIFNHIDEHGGKTTDDCGFHISLSLNDRGWTRYLDPIKMGVLVDEKYIYKKFPSREGNEYAQSVHEDIGSLINNNERMVEKIKEQSYRKKPKFTESHHMAINIEHLAEKNKYVEFRYIGGKNYHKRWSDIKKLTAMFIRSMRWGCSDHYHEQFIRKLEQLKRRSMRYADV